MSVKKASTVDITDVMACFLQCPIQLIQSEVLDSAPVIVNTHHNFILTITRGTQELCRLAVEYAQLLGTDHYFPGGEGEGGGGGGIKHFHLQTFFFNLCTSANIFFRNLNYFFYTYHVCKQFILSF